MLISECYKYKFESLSVEGSTQTHNANVCFAPPKKQNKATDRNFINTLLATHCHLEKNLLVCLFIIQWQL